MTKMTITEQINAITFAEMTEADFNFLKERALKSVRVNTGERKPTKAQKENEGFKADILAILGEQAMTASQVGAQMGWNGSQKASALLNQLVADGKVEKFSEKRVTLFKAVA